MKKLLLVVLAATLMLPLFADSETIDLSAMSYDELVSLSDRINLAMWNSAEWEEVFVPSGIWIVGKDIPAGHWTIHASFQGYTTIRYGTKLSSDGKSISTKSDDFFMQVITVKGSRVYSHGDLTFIDVYAEDGAFIEIKGGGVTFTPYCGKPSFEFN